MSFEEMKREPTDPVEMDGIESSMGKRRDSPPGDLDTILL